MATQSASQSTATGASSCSILQELIELNERSAKHFESAAHNIEDRGLSQALYDFAWECQDFAQQIRRLPECPAAGRCTDKDLPGEFVDHLNRLQKCIAHHEPLRQILEQTEEAERRVLDEYLKAMDETTTDDAKTLVEDQYQQLKQMHAWMHQVLEAAA